MYIYIYIYIYYRGPRGLVGARAGARGPGREGEPPYNIITTMLYHIIIRTCNNNNNNVISIIIIIIRASIQCSILS